MAIHLNSNSFSLSREMFRVLDEAKKNPPLKLKPRNHQRRRPSRPQNGGGKTREKREKSDDFPSLSDETSSSNANFTNSYADILRKGMKK